MPPPQKKRGKPEIMQSEESDDAGAQWNECVLTRKSKYIRARLHGNVKNCVSLQDDAARCEPEQDGQQQLQESLVGNNLAGDQSL